MAWVIPTRSNAAGSFQWTIICTREGHLWCSARIYLRASAFLLYTADIPSIATKHGICIHCYADDGQLYLFDKASASDSIVQSVTDCILEIDNWMSSNRLKLNSEKTQFSWLGTRQQLSKTNAHTVNIGSSTIHLQANVNNLGVIIDEQFTMKEHVRKICCSAYNQLRKLRVVRKSLSTKACEALVHAFVSSGLDYHATACCTALAEKQLDFLQSVLRSAARLVLRKRKIDSISIDMRDKLHWLPAKQRIEYKICMLVYKCRRNEAPAYLVEMLPPVVPSSRYNLRSESEKIHDFDIPRTRSVRSGPRSFSVSGPTLWNSLPFSVKEAASLNIGTFKKVLKITLFSRMLNTVWLGNICLFMNCTGAFVTVLP